MKKQENGREKKNIILTNFKKLLPVLILAMAMLVLTLAFLPQVRRLSTEEGMAEFKAFVDGLGFGGWIVTLGIQLLQIFVAFIPGEPIEIMLGVVWGPWLGTFTCLLGIFIGTLVIFLLVRRFGRKFVAQVVGTEDLTKYRFLSNKSRLELTVFILFFIPGTPKDALTYIAPLAPINPIKYLLISTFARIPSIITSTILGDSVMEGDYTTAIIVFVLTALISVLGIVFGNKYIEKRKNEGGKY